LPLLTISLGNALIWSWIMRDGFSLAAIVGVTVTTLLAGAVTPKGLQWFAVLCVCLPVLMAYAPRHGALICHLIFGFRFPLLWIFFLMNFTPFFLLWAGLVWIGDGIVNRLKRRFGLIHDHVAFIMNVDNVDEEFGFGVRLHIMVRRFDMTNHPVPGTAVTLIAKDTGKSVSAAASGNGGQFTISDVTPQHYILKLEKEDSCPKMFRWRFCPACRRSPSPRATIALALKYTRNMHKRTDNGQKSVH